MALTTVSPALLDTQAQYTGFKNRIINGDMRIDQRNAGASFSNPNGYQFSVDRWTTYGTQAGKFSTQQTSGAVLPPSGFTNYLGFTSLSAYSLTSSDIFFLTHRIEGANTSDFNWGISSAATATLSFVVCSSLTGLFGGVIQCGSGSYPFTYSISSSNTWTNVVISIPANTFYLPASTSNGKGITILFGLGVGSANSASAGSWQASSPYSATGTVSVVGTAGATWYITGVQLEKGSTATSFDYRDYGSELIRCQRYYQIGRTHGQLIGIYWLGAQDSFHIPQIAFPVVMRASITGTAVANQLGGAYWTNPATSTFSAQSTAGWTAVGTSTNLYLRNDRQAGGNTPTSGMGYSFEAGVFWTASAEL